MASSKELVFLTQTVNSKTLAEQTAVKQKMRALTKNSYRVSVSNVWKSSTVMALASSFLVPTKSFSRNCQQNTYDSNSTTIEITLLLMGEKECTPTISHILQVSNKIHACICLKHVVRPPLKWLVWIIFSEHTCELLLASLVDWENMQMLNSRQRINFYAFIDINMKLRWCK